MKLYINTHTDPYFNLAAEEYLLSTAHEDIVMLWRNGPSVIIGKNQNAHAELNLPYIRENGIKVVRRITGGGAVFHDLGNLNFTFITPAGGKLANGIGDGIDFAYFTKPIIEALGELGLSARLSGRNDIVVETPEGERKISGNAQCVVNGTTMHHGTLLFSSRLERLRDALRPDPDKLRAKGIASVQSRVANICDLLCDDVKERVCGVERFTDHIASRLSSAFSVIPETLPIDITAEIEALMLTKYSTEQWNIGRFGDFSMTRKKRFPYGSVEVSVTVENGRIMKIIFGGDFFGALDVSVLADRLAGCVFTKEALICALAENCVEKYILGSNADEIAELLI